MKLYHQLNRKKVKLFVEESDQVKEKKLRKWKGQMWKRGGHKLWWRIVYDQLCQNGVPFQPQGEIILRAHPPLTHIEDVHDHF